MRILIGPPPFFAFPSLSSFVKQIPYDATGKPFDKSEGVYSFLNVLLRPVSSGTVRLASSDPSDPCSATSALSPHLQTWPSSAHLSGSLCDSQRTCAATATR